MLSYSGLSSNRKVFLRFLRILCYILYHSAIFAGTCFSYSLIIATFIDYVSDPETPDHELFQSIYWPTLLFSILLSIKETAMYSLFSFQYLSLSDDDFNTWLDKKYKKCWEAYGKVAAVTKSIMGGMSLGVAFGHITQFATDDPAMLRKAAIVGLPAGITAFIIQTYYYYRAEHQNFSGPKVMAASIAVSLPSVTNYVMGTLSALQNKKYHLSDTEQTSAYIGLGIFSAFAIYYYVRMYYEIEVEKARKCSSDPESIQSCFGKLEQCLSKCYDETKHPALHKLLTIGDYIRRGVVIGLGLSGGLLYTMWLAWRNVAVSLGYFKSADLKLYPTSWFDLSTLLILGMANLPARFFRFDHTANGMQHNNVNVVTEERKSLLPKYSTNGTSNGHTNGSPA